MLSLTVIQILNILSDIMLWVIILYFQKEIKPLRIFKNFSVYRYFLFRNYVTCEIIKQKKLYLYIQSTEKTV
jgi:hypothetical protein